jgi:hypothetical protein
VQKCGSDISNQLRGKMTYMQQIKELHIPPMINISFVP